jgi:hypothetical protein
MTDESLPEKDKNKIPPKLNLRQSGAMKQDSSKKDENAGKQQSSESPKQEGEKAGGSDQGAKQPKESPIKISQPGGKASLKINIPSGQQGKEAGAEKQDQKPSTAPGAKQPERAEQKTGEGMAKPKQTGDSEQPTVRAKKPEEKSKPGAPVKLKGGSEEEKSEEGGKNAVGIPAGRGGSAAKKETSRIPLGQAKSASGESEGGPERPKTIRISPAAQQPSGGGQTPEKAPEKKPGADQKQAEGESKEDQKRKTSRISLESALGMGEGGKETGPKTIKLKRPGAGAGKVSGAPQPGKEEEAGKSKEQVSKTSQIPEEATPEEGTTPTRRRTIKVKRPGQGAGKAPPAPSRPAEQPQAAPAAQQVAASAPAQVKEPGITFSLIGIAAAIIVLVTIYVMAAQAFGPNDVSLTQLSYGLPGLDLSWPGQVQ